MAEATKKWRGKLACDFCAEKGVELETEFFVDGATKMGPWAMMCDAHFHRVGVGVGPGSGQRYDAKTGVKVAG
jgi:hypothetical protein